MSLGTITRWGTIKQRIMQASAGGCNERQAMIIANEAIPALLNKGPWVGSIADVLVQTFQPEFSLPYQYERAITAEQCFDGDLNMGWYAVENADVYIEPSLWGDAVLIDQGTRSTERPFFGAGKVVAFFAYPEDATFTVRIWGTFQNEQVFVQPPDGGPTGTYPGSPFEDLTPAQPGGTATPSLGTYDGLYQINKPVTLGPVLICAFSPSGQMYRLIEMAPYETEAARRWYKMPEMKFVQVQPRSISTSPTGFAFDTQYVNAPFVAGDSITLTGFCPIVFNGLWTVNAVVGSKVYVQARAGSGWVEPTDQVSVFGIVTKQACLTCSALKRWINIVDDQSDVILSNTLAMRQAVRAMWEWDAGRTDAYDKLMMEAVQVLKDEVTRYGQDPTHTLKRKAMYRYYYNNFPEESVGYIIGRFALEIENGMRYGKSDWMRLLNEAQEYIIVSGKYGNSTSKRDYTIQPMGLVICDPDIQSLLSAQIGGRRCIIEDKFYDSTTNKGLIGYGIDGPSGYQVGGYFTNGSLAGGQPRTIVLSQQESIVDQDGCCRTVYKVEPCQALVNCCVCTVAKLRYKTAKCVDDLVVVPCYTALKFMVEAFIARDAKNFDSFQILSFLFMDTVATEKRNKKGGAQARVGYTNQWTGRFLRGRGR